MDRPTSETPSEERTEIEPSQADPVDLGKTLSSINDNLQGMSKLLLHLASGQSTVYEDISHIDDDQRSSHLLPTGHPDTPNGHYDTLNEQFDISTGPSSAQVNNHGTSSGKQRLGPALSSRNDVDANAIDALSIHASDSEDDEIPLDKAVADLLSQAKDLPEPNDAHGLLDTLAQALEAPSDVSDAISPKLAEIVNSHWGKFLPPETLKPILAKYSRPANCETFFPVKVNKEAWENLRMDKKQHDFRLAHLQQTIQAVAIISLQTTEFLLSNSLISNDLKSTHISANVDALALLGHATASLSSLRRASLKPTFKPEYQSLCNKTDLESHSPFLFGEDFGKRIKDIDESRKIGRAFKAPGGQKSFTQFAVSARRAPSGYHPYRNQSKRPQNDFLWKGSQFPPFRKKPYFNRRPPQKRFNQQEKQF